MSDSSIRTNPSMEEPSNMMSPSSAFSNWLWGTSTFLLTPRMSVNWSRRNATSCFFKSSRMSRFVAPADLVAGGGVGSRGGGGGEGGGGGAPGHPPLPPPPPPSRLPFHRLVTAEHGRRRARRHR